MKTFFSRCRCLGLSTLILCAVMPIALHAQELPFVEPAETHMHGEVKPLFVEAQPAKNGRWRTLPSVMPINPVHAALMKTGNVLVIAGSGNDRDNKNFQAAVWNPKTETVRTFGISWDMFCNGMVILPDGRPLILGGNLRYDNRFTGEKFLGEPRTAVFDPVSESFTDMPNMSGGRWYPTGTVLGNGSVLVYSGSNHTTGDINRTVQIWNGTAWTPAGTSFPGVPLYPRQHLLPNGKVFVSGSQLDSQMYDPVARTFTKAARTNFGRERVYGTSVLLPLTPANGFKPKVIISGGSYPAATDTTELIDLSAASPRWVYGPRMAKARIQLNATLLPNGKVLVSGGAGNDDDPDTAVKEAQLYDPVSNTFSSASSMEFPRLYHSNTLLLPDATVVALGGNPKQKSYQHEIEIYSPPYLFKADGTPAKRPVIAWVHETVPYGQPFFVQTEDAGDIKSVVLVRAGSVTHAFDMDQRLVEVPFAHNVYKLVATLPADRNLTPPGFYLLFIVNYQGVPSVGEFVQVR